MDNHSEFYSVKLIVASDTVGVQRLRQLVPMLPNAVRSKGDKVSERSTLRNKKHRLIYTPQASGARDLASAIESLLRELDPVRDQISALPLSVEAWLYCVVDISSDLSRFSFSLHRDLLSRIAALGLRLDVVAYLRTGANALDGRVKPGHDNDNEAR